MSTATAQPGAPADAVASAADLVYRSYYVPAYFAKLAGLGLSPRTEEEAGRLLSIGNKLLAWDQAREAREAVKSASWLDVVESELDSELSGRDPRDEYDDRVYAKRATADADLVRAALTIQHAAAAAGRA